MLTAILVVSGIAVVLGALLGWAAIRFRVEGNPVVDQVNGILPQTQCGQCGFAGCRPYAEAIVEGARHPPRNVQGHVLQSRHRDEARGRLDPRVVFPDAGWNIESMNPAYPPAAGRSRAGWVLTTRKLGRLVSLLWPFARGYRGRLVGGSFLSAILIALRLAQPWPMKWVVDALSGSGRHAWYAVWDPGTAVLVLSLLYIITAASAALAEYYQELVLSGLGNRILYDFRSSLFSRLLRLPLTFHVNRTVGELVTRIISDTARLRRGINGLLTRSLQVVVLFVSSVAVLFQLQWQMALIVTLFAVNDANDASR